MEVHEICTVLLNIFAILLMFVTLQVPPPDENHFPLQHRVVSREFLWRTVLVKRRVKIEHVIKEVKTFKAVSQI